MNFFKEFFFREVAKHMIIQGFILGIITLFMPETALLTAFVWVLSSISFFSGGVASVSLIKKLAEEDNDKA